MKSYKYFDIITVFFVAALLISNIASTKIAAIGPFALDGGTLLFPITYIFNDVLTEVYGFSRTRKVIWLGFGSALLMSVTLFTVGLLPAAAGWENQDSYEKILGQTPRIVIASLIAYFFGEFSNSYVLAKLKVATKGKWLWLRTIGSTVVGELLDSMIFVTVAFLWVLPNGLVIELILFNYFFKTAIEVIFTPLTYLIVNKLKRRELEDHFDAATNFNPLRFGEQNN